MEIENSAQPRRDRGRGDSQPRRRRSTRTPAPAPGRPTRRSTELPAPASMDVITNAIIYKPAQRRRGSASPRALGDPERRRRGVRQRPRADRPGVQRPTAGGDPFLFVVNHFKSKGSAGPFPGDADPATARARPTARRVLQAHGAARLGRRRCSRPRRASSRVVLAGDFNSYPRRTRCRSCTTPATPTSSSTSRTASTPTRSPACPARWTTSWSTTPRSSASTGADIWNINAGESLALEYSRCNYHVTDFHAPDPYRSSDHDPVVLGLTRRRRRRPVEVQILGTNDFHGRIWPMTGPRAARRAVPRLQPRGQNPNTVFAAAGDLIGASTFESFIQHDKPTIDALNEAGLEVSAVGNHEFDAGLRRPGRPGDGAVRRHHEPARVAPSGSTSPPTSEVQGATTPHALDEHLDQDFGRRAGRLRRRGDRGPARRWSAPDGIADIEVTDIVERDQRGCRRARRPREPTSSSCSSTRVRRPRRWPPRPTRTPPSARSSTASTPTWTRSSRATPTWPTTTRSRSPHGWPRAAR